MKDFYSEAILELCEQCTDTDLLELVYGLLAEGVETDPEPAPCQILELPQERRWAA